MTEGLLMLFGLVVASLLGGGVFLARHRDDSVGTKTIKPNGRREQAPVDPRESPWRQFLKDERNSFPDALPASKLASQVLPSLVIGLGNAGAKVLYELENRMADTRLDSERLHVFHVSFKDIDNQYKFSKYRSIQINRPTVIPEQEWRDEKNHPQWGWARAAGLQAGIPITTRHRVRVILTNYLRGGLTAGLSLYEELRRAFLTASEQVRRADQRQEISAYIVVSSEEEVSAVVGDIAALLQYIAQNANIVLNVHVLLDLPVNINQVNTIQPADEKTAALLYELGRMTVNAVTRLEFNLREAFVCSYDKSILSTLNLFPRETNSVQITPVLWHWLTSDWRNTYTPREPKDFPVVNFVFAHSLVYPVYAQRSILRIELLLSLIEGRRVKPNTSGTRFSSSTDIDRFLEAHRTPETFPGLHPLVEIIKNKVERRFDALEQLSRRLEGWATDLRREKDALLARLLNQAKMREPMQLLLEPRQLSETYPEEAYKEILKRMGWVATYEDDTAIPNYPLRLLVAGLKSADAVHNSRELPIQNFQFIREFLLTVVERYIDNLAADTGIYENFNAHPAYNALQNAARNRHDHRWLPLIEKLRRVNVGRVERLLIYSRAYVPDSWRQQIPHDRVEDSTDNTMITQVSVLTDVPLAELTLAQASARDMRQYFVHDIENIACNEFENHIRGPLFDKIPVPFLVLLSYKEALNAMKQCYRHGVLTELLEIGGAQDERNRYFWRNRIWDKFITPYSTNDAFRNKVHEKLEKAKSQPLSDEQTQRRNVFLDFGDASEFDVFLSKWLKDQV